MISQIQLAKCLLSKEINIDSNFGPYFQYNIAERYDVKCRYIYPNLCYDEFLFKWEMCKDIGYNMIDIHDTTFGIIWYHNQYYVSDIIDSFHVWKDVGQDPEPGIVWIKKNRLKYYDYDAFLHDCPDGAINNSEYKELWGIFGLCNIIKYKDMLRLKQFFIGG
jgi:hypothetical protein